MKRPVVASLLLLMSAVFGRSQQLEPVFPEENRSLIFVEGEDAVSTNFSREPILSYSCSASRTLQLARSTGLQEGRAFYATYVFYVEEPGAYELWYGGTPPGPKDDLYASYSSPFSYRLDRASARSVYREDVVVVEQYAPAYYWSRVAALDLTAGPHTLEFLVAEKRRHDGRYFFYLDCFFLLRREDGRKAVVAGPLPKVFPRDLDNRSIDFPFRALEDYQIAIRDRPNAIEPYIELAQMYSLLGDYLNALKHLRRAEFLDPENREVKLLVAKNRIWKGDVAEGLKAYRSLLLLEPRRLDLWLEAGKVAAWVGRYEESVSFYKNGLEQFPEDLALLVNLGLTYSWSAQREEAERVFKQAAEKAQADLGQLLELADVYYVNGYTPQAVQLLESGLKRYPDRLAPYLALERIYAAEGQSAKAEEVRRLIETTFVGSPQLSRYLDAFHRRQSLKDEVIAGYISELERRPDNLELREVLAQTYFWNGQRKKAIAEERNLLANHVYLRLNALDRSSSALLELFDKSHVMLGFLNAVPAAVKIRQAELASQKTAYSQAQKAYADFQAKAKAAKDKGQPPPAASGEDPLDRLKRAEEELAEAVGRAQAYSILCRASLEGWRSDAAELETLRAADQADNEALDKVVKATRWEWDRRGLIEELASIDNVLASYTVGRLEQMELKLAAAESRLKGLGAAAPGSAYGLFQTLLWQGRTEEAFALLEPQRVEMAALVPYLDELAVYKASLELEEPAAPGAIDEVGPAEQELKSLEADALAGKKEVQSGLAALRSVLEKRLVHAMYNLEVYTMSLRNDLGDYYLKEQDLGSAIRQFRLVLSVDPWNIEAIYRLGKVYELKGEWSEAMALYRRVYFMDPAHENVTGQYNQLTRKHSDEAVFSAYTLADTSRLIYHGQASYSGELNSLLGLRIGYEADGTRLYRPPVPEETASQYLVQSLSLGLPLSLAGGKASLEPSAGAFYWNDSFAVLAEGTAEGNRNWLWPQAALKASAHLGPFLDLTGGYAYGPKEETFDPQRTLRYLHSGEMNLNTDLSFIKAWPFEDSSLRTYGKLEYLPEDPNWIGTAVQEAYLGVLDKPGLKLDLLGNLVFQHAGSFQHEYYTPIGVLVAGGGLRASSWINLAEGTALSVSLRASGASYREKLLSAGAFVKSPVEDPIKRLQLEGEANLSLIKGEATYSVRVLANSTWCYWKQNQPVDWDRDYWSLYLSLGYSARMPRLLAP